MRRFPLVARPRPAALPLADRIAELTALATAAAGQTESGRRLAAAATVQNRAALIASDCGLPELARVLCRQQLQACLRAHPLNAQTAPYAMEPAVNLARLLIRQGDGARAHQLLAALYIAATEHTSADVDGIAVDFRELAPDAELQHALRRAVWTALLADGTRALAQAGRWQEAVEQVRLHRGVGLRLLDGRQIAIVARSLAADTDAALSLVDGTEPVDRWEETVAVALKALCLTIGARPTERVGVELVRSYREMEFTPGLGLFHTQLGLTVLDLTEARDDTVAAGIVSDAITSQDGYVARAVLAHPRCSVRLNGAERQALEAVVEAAGLHAGVIPYALMADLHAAVDLARASIDPNPLATDVPPALLDEEQSVEDNSWQRTEDGQPGQVRQLDKEAAHHA
ncbi:hypothetical protein [Kitasatospora sp. NPDC057223]|uniref:hypothetical protein n=1 Tax=Kitasatospora sp. NPDC057223 TaxID=3346055 RepID=UPI0036424DC8